MGSIKRSNPDVRGQYLCLVRRWQAKWISKSSERGEFKHSWMYSWELVYWFPDFGWGLADYINENPEVVRWLVLEDPLVTSPTTEDFRIETKNSIQILKLSTKIEG